MKVFASLVVLAVTIMATQGKPVPRDFINTMVLGDKVTVTWEVLSSTETILFEVTAQATGWIGFGLSYQANMYDADLIMGGVDADNKPYFTDRHGGGPGQPGVDASQDWVLLGANEEAGVTKLRFYRKFSTGDVEDIDFQDNDTWFIWALGPNDDTTQYHVADRGNAIVNILKDPNSS